VGGRIVPGTDVTISLLDLNFRPDVPADEVLDVEVTCLNRDLPSRLPFGGDQPRLLLQGGAPVRKVVCLVRPTATRRPDLGAGLLWRLLSHLSLNHLSIADGPDATDALREILRLYDFVATEETRSAVAGLVSVSSTPAVARLRGPGRGAIARGTEIRLALDPRRFTGGDSFLFASVLERFFALYGSVNSFTRTVATVEGREGELCRWPPRAGATPLL
jgi:type VI secretion system protein ImpG